MKEVHRNKRESVSASHQAGNVFFAIFGAVALVGLLGAATMTFMKGPLSSAVKLTKQNSAETQMAIGAQIAVISSANSAGNGDCDGDLFIEPMEWRSATSEPVPTNGGLIPLALGASKMDPWGTEYGYCVWNHGGLVSGSGCGANLLSGTNNSAYPVVAFVSAGPDKTFTTTCRSFAVADANSDGDLDDVGDNPLISEAAETDDDIIQTFTYDEASSASGGLWNVKSGDANTAVIGKKIETTGTASLQGGILLPDSSLVTCDATTAGVMAKNASGTDIEICDGAGNWVPITGDVSEGLEFSPSATTTMDVSGACGNPTCYSSNVTFTLTNNITPAQTSQTLSVLLTNLDNFEFVSNTCGGVALASGASCTVVVRAKSMSNLTYSGKIRVIGNNSPEVSLTGTASGFPGCTVGSKTKEGYFIGCGIGTAPNTYDLIVTPSGCTGGVVNPSCSGGNDTFTAAITVGSNGGSLNGCCTSSGWQNTVDMMAYSGVDTPQFPAAAYCSALSYKGYDDWFLPNATEMQTYFYPNRATVGYTVGSYYYTSSNYDLATALQFRSYMVSTNTFGYLDGWNLALVRCMRRSPAATVTPTADTLPFRMNVYFKPSNGTSAGEVRTSNTIKIQGLTSAVPISISGGTSAQYSVNGGAYTSSAGTVANGDIIDLRATSPVAGNEDTVSLTVGSTVWTWKVRTAENNTIRIFTTSTTTNYGAFGGIAGADSFCTTRAAAGGLPGSWTAVIADTRYTEVSDRLPWNWNKLLNTNGNQVANGLNDFLDGTVSAPMNYSEYGTPSQGSWVWTGLDVSAVGGFINSDGYTDCLNWTSASGGQGGYAGDSASTANGMYFFTQQLNCGNSLRLLCMESIGSTPDTDPSAVNIMPKVVFSAGALGVSNSIQVSGITTNVTASIVPSAGTVDIIKNGVSVGGGSTPVGLNDTLVFTLTAPTVLGTQNTATITIGSDTYTWWVGYADSTKEAKAFVTSTGKRGDQLGGLAGAHAICEARAAASPYGLSAKWKAILSTSTVNAAYNLPWNWKNLKSVSGETIVNGGIGDLFDGSIDLPFVTNELGGSAAGSLVWTGSLQDGFYSGINSQTSCADWTAAGSSALGACGTPNSTSSSWLATSSSMCNSSSCQWSPFRLYCIEDVDNTVPDTVPNAINLEYAIQVAVSSRQSSSSVTISGLSIGATTTLSVAATGGDPKFTVNGGVETDSATVQNGDVIVFKMDAPATGNSSNKMTITGGGSTLGYWRVWTGDTTGTAVKRIFITPKTNFYCGFGGLANADSTCNSAASSAALGGTWKAIVSGYDEANWAINRIGYDWSTLELTNGTDVVMGGNIWNTNTTPLMSAIHRNAANTTSYYTTVFTNTDKYGKAIYQTSAETCADWTVTNYSYTRYVFGTSSVIGSTWTNNQTTSVGGGGGETIYFYCVEQ